MEEILRWNSSEVDMGKMDITSVIGDAAEKGIQTVVLVCGPDGMANGARKEVVGCVEREFGVDLLEEKFAW